MWAGGATLGLARTAGWSGLRSLSRSHGRAKSNPEWVAMKRAEQERRDARWRQRRTASPFQRNVGLSRQLKGMGVDPDDPVLEAYAADRQIQPDELADELLERTERYRNEIDPRRHPFYDAHVDRSELALTIARKKFFPEPRSPNLLTYLEKTMIRHLHATDPGLWTFERLAEGFPATASIIKRVIKSGRKNFQPSSARQIEKHDRQVLANWQRLAQGQLEVPEALSRQLRANYGQDAAARVLSTQARSELAEGIKRRWLSDQPEPEKTIPPGEFASIVQDYRAKVDAHRALQLSGGDLKAVTRAGSNPSTPGPLFDPKSEFDPEVNVPTPYRDTAILASALDWRQDQRMTLDRFRTQFLKTLQFSQYVDPQLQKDINPHRVAFEKWLAEEKIPGSVAKTPEPLSTHELEEIVESESQPNTWTGSPTRPRVFSLNEPSADHIPVQRAIQMKIDIPTDIRVKGGVYQKNDCFYDEDGDFLHKVPQAPAAH
eukprot:maker-scaffold1305_size49401-snap-gene-0.17 protein:Tk01697 transcript:maker-scaffold1305_size49401-snap-gene-0.17-mRNA-1 annotation:"Neugrin"